ncbi:MAG TPA: hypothetical protein VGK34_00500 [Armatimonadota bacterium]|jgi:hypothetical protein
MKWYEDPNSRGNKISILVIKLAFLAIAVDLAWVYVHKPGQLITDIGGAAYFWVLLLLGRMKAEVRQPEIRIPQRTFAMWAALTTVSLGFKIYAVSIQSQPSGYGVQSNLYQLALCGVLIAVVWTAVIARGLIAAKDYKDSEETAGDESKHWNW